MISKKYYDLCIKSVSGNINTDEDRLLKEWLLQSNENQNKFDEIKNMWMETGSLKIPEMPDKEMEWNKLQENIKQDHTDKSVSLLLRKIKSYFDFSFYPRLQPALLGLLLLITVFVTVFIFMNQKQKVSDYKTIVTQNSETKKIELQDGSIVHLNNGSRIEVPSNYNENERKVKLEGEAFFEVVKNSKPFIITTENAQIEVLGTKFNVWTREAKTKIIVKEGRVNLKQKEAATGGIELQGGFLSTVVGNNDPAFPIPVDADYLVGWLNKKLIFEHTKLSEIVEELERLYDKEFIINDASLNNLTLTGVFDYSNLDSTLEMICLALDLKYQVQSGNYFLEANRMDK